MKINVKQKIYICYLFITGILIIVLYLYFRFLRTRTSYSLDDLRGNLSLLGLFLSISFIATHLVTLITLFYYFYKQYYKITRTSKLVQMLSDVIDHIYWKPLEYIYDLIVVDPPYIGNIITHINEFTGKGNAELRCKLYRHSYIIFDYLPKLLVSSIFFMDLVFGNQILYFIYSIWLLIIPIIYKIYLKLCSTLITCTYEDILACIDVQPEGEKYNEKHEPDENGAYFTWIFTIKPGYEDNLEVLKEYTDWFWTLQLMEVNYKAIKNNLAKYDLYIILLTSSLYLSAAIYRLIYILF